MAMTPLWLYEVSKWYLVLPPCNGLHARKHGCVWQGRKLHGELRCT